MKHSDLMGLTYKELMSLTLEDLVAVDCGGGDLCEHCPLCYPVNRGPPFFACLPETLRAIFGQGGQS